MDERAKGSRKIENANKRFFDAWAYLYDVTPLKPWLQYIQKRIANSLPLHNNQKILDVGCGTGDALWYLSRKTNAHLYGIDISENMLSKARKRLGGKATLALKNIEDTGFKGNTFDIIISTEAFHHFPDPGNAVQEMHRILKKNGELIIADVNFHSNAIHKLFRILEPGNVKLYSKEEFKRLFENNKFLVLEQKRIGWFAIVTTGRKQ